MSVTAPLISKILCILDIIYHYFSQRRDGHAKVFKCGISACIFGTSVKLSLVIHTNKNHYGFKCPHDNCTYFTSDKKDSLRHKLAVHTKRAQLDPKLLDSLVEDTKNFKVTDDGRTKYDEAKSKAKYDVAKARLRYDEAKVKMSKLKCREAKSKLAARGVDDEKREKARR